MLQGSVEERVSADSLASPSLENVPLVDSGPSRSCGLYSDQEMVGSGHITDQRWGRRRLCRRTSLSGVGMAVFSSQL